MYAELTEAHALPLGPPDPHLTGSYFVYPSFTTVPDLPDSSSLVLFCDGVSYGSA